MTLEPDDWDRGAPVRVIGACRGDLGWWRRSWVVPATVVLPPVMTKLSLANDGTTRHHGISLPGAPSWPMPGFDELAFAEAEHGPGFGAEAGGAATASRALLGAISASRCA